MRVVNLASGSDGNITYIESANAKVLVDVGLSCREIMERLALLNVTGNDIDAIFITHEHSDHIKGLDVFASKFNIPVYAHIDGWPAISEKLTRLPANLKWSFSDEPFYLKDILVAPFKVPHDSACCVGYTFSSDGKSVSITTDLGKIDVGILERIKNSQIVYLEANHNVEMLKNNPYYPVALKNRILSSHGHLSNLESAKAISYLAQSGVRQVVLSHLSRHNNRPDVAYKEITDYLKTLGILEGVNIKIDIASHQPGKIFKIS